MKVLYVSGAAGADYMCDVAMHGLRSLLGPDCVDVNKMWFMYDTSPHYMFHSLYKLLPDIPVDREDIPAKIAARYFDAIIYGSTHRCRDFLDEVRTAYPRNRIAFIDGEDDGGLAPAVGQGWYFKRELYSPHPDILPIQFGIPKEKIRPIDLSRKATLMAHCDPRDRSTYQYYDSESRYYDQYSDAYFGYTMKKGGWDCMRHVEILAAGCVPYFAGLDDCPADTLALFPREHFIQARDLHDRHFEKAAYVELLGAMHRDILPQVTTEAIARRVLDRLT
jgi:hypothetical protein